MATTTAFGWSTPDDTSLVKDGAAAIRTLGSSIDTSMAELKGGTTGQVLSKTSNTDMDFTWASATTGDITSVVAGVGISGGGTSGNVTITNSMATTITTAGDLIKGTGSGTFDRLGIGSTGQVLTVSAGVPAWANPVSGLTLVRRSSFSSVANTGTTFDGVFTSTYKSYLVVVEQLYAASSGDTLQMQMRIAGTTRATSYYATNLLYASNATTATSIGGTAATEFRICTSSVPTKPLSGQWFFHHVGQGAERPDWTGNIINANNPDFIVSMGIVDAAIATDGFLLKSSSSAITGTLAIYGLAV